MTRFATPLRSRGRRAIIVGALVIGGLIGLLAGCRHQSTAPTGPRVLGPNPPAGGEIAPPPRGRLYLGSYPGYGAGEENRVSAGAIAAYRRDSGRRAAWVYFSNEWGQEGIRYPAGAVATIRRSGSVPFIRLMPRTSTDEYVRERRFTLERIIRGEFDSQLRAWGAQAARDRRPLIAEFLTEVNGDWFAWNGRYHGAGRRDGYGDPRWPDGPERARDAYRHVVTQIRAGGATNITWVFHFDAWSSPDVWWNAPRYAYPGDDVVDWVGYSAYGAQQRRDRWSWPEAGIRRGYAQAARLSARKPIVLLEFAVAERPGASKATWIARAFRAIESPQLSRLIGVTWWNERFQNPDGSWTDLRITSSPPARRAFRAEIATPRYLTALRRTPAP